MVEGKGTMEPQPDQHGLHGAGTEGAWSRLQSACSASFPCVLKARKL